MKQPTTQEKPDIRTDLRTEEVQHIVDRMPVTFFSRAAFLLLFVVAGLLIMGWFIRYPDVVTGQLIVNSDHTSVKLMATTFGRLKLYCKSQDVVQAGAFIACIQNTADPEDVKQVSGLLKHFNVNDDAPALRKLLASLRDEVALGELSTSYYTFVSALRELVAFRDDRLFDAQQRNLGALLKEQEGILRNTEHKHYLGSENLNIAKSFFYRDSSLYVEKVTSRAEFDRAQSNFLSAQSVSRQLNNEVISMRKEVLGTASRIQELDLQHRDNEQQLIIKIQGMYNTLKSSIALWEEKYLFMAPIAGKVEFQQFWTDNQFVQSGEPVFSIIPEEQVIVGQMYLPTNGAGRVHAGQEVMIKLDDYPYMEYGTITGTVRNVSLATHTLRTETGSRENYLVNVTLPRKLKTNYGADLDFRFELKGTADIITNDRRLLERLFDNLRSVTRK